MTDPQRPPDPTPDGAVATAPGPAAYGPGDDPTRVRAALSWRAEGGRQWSRRRTLCRVRRCCSPCPSSSSARSPSAATTAAAAGATSRIFDLAQSGAANFSLVVVFLSSELLLVLLAALFFGDAVPSEASWASLRYLLVAPVQRARLLTSKLVIAFLSTALATVLLPLWALLVGGLAYGWAR